MSGSWGPSHAGQHVRVSGQRGRKQARLSTPIAPHRELLICSPHYLVFSIKCSVSALENARMDIHPRTDAVAADRHVGVSLNGWSHRARRSLPKRGDGRCSGSELLTMTLHTRLSSHRCPQPVEHTHHSTASRLRSPYTSCCRAVGGFPKAESLGQGWCQHCVCRCRAGRAEGPGACSGVRWRRRKCCRCIARPCKRHRGLQRAASGEG